MKWFYNLKMGVRVGIAVAAWLPVLIFTGAIGGSVGENAENLQPWQAIIFVLLLAVGVFFTVFAVKAHQAETKTESKAKAVESERKQTAQTARAAGVITMSEDAIKSPPVINTEKEALFSDLPAYVTKLIKNGNEEMQDNISSSNIGDDIYIDFDYEKCLYSCSTAGGEIGYLPENIGDKLSGKFCVKITNITENNTGKFVVEVSIYPQISDNGGISVRILSGVNFPVHTKVRGVTFEGRQVYLSESKAGDSLKIRHTPTTEYPNTIAVINERTGKTLGNIGSDLSESLRAAFGAGCAFDGEIVEITGGSDGQNYGCNIAIKGSPNAE